MSDFNPTTAIPVRKREDGLLEVDEFNPSTASEIPQISQGKGMPVLSNGQSFAELVGLQKQKGYNIAQVAAQDISWVLQSDPVKKGIEVAINTLSTFGLYPVVQGIRGAVGNKDKEISDRILKGITSPEETPRLTDKFAVENEPEFAKIVRSISEDFLSYGAAGLTKSAVRSKMLANDIARRIERGAEAYATKTVGEITPNAGVSTTEQAVFINKIQQAKEGYRRVVITKLKAIDVSSGKTRIQEYSDSKSFLSLIADEVDNLSIKSYGFGTGGLNFKIGQKISFKNPEGKDLIGEITKLAGKTAHINLEGKTIIASLSQLSLPESVITEQYRKESKAIINESLVNQVGEKLGESPNPSQVKSIIREQTGQTQDSKDLLNYLKEKYSNQIIAGQLEEEVSKKLAEPLAASAVKPIIRETSGQNLKGEPINVTDKQALKEVLRKQVEAASGAEKVTREQIFDIQTNMVNVINESDLAPEDKAKFISTIKNTNTPAKFNKMLPQIEEKINQLEIKAEKENLLSEIKRVVERAQTSESIAIDYAKQVEALVDKVNLRNMSKKASAKLQATKDYVAKKIAAGEEVSLPQRIIDKLDLKDLPNEELQKLLNDIKSLEQLGETKQRLKESKYEREKTNIKSELLGSIKAIKSKQLPSVPIGSTPNKMADRYIKLLNYISTTKVGLTPIEGLADITGMQRMKTDLDNNYSKFLTFNDDRIKKWHDITKDFNITNFRTIGAYAIAQQDGGLVKLRESGIRNPEKIELTPSEQKAYDFMRETFDGLYPEIKEYMKDVYNKDVGKVKNYVTFIVDSDALNSLEMRDRIGSNVEGDVRQMHTNLTKTVKKSFTKEREEKAVYKIELNADKIFRRHIDDVAYLLTMGKDIKKYFEIVNSPEVRKSLGDIGATAWLEYLDLAARKFGVHGSQKIGVVDVIRQNVGMGVLAGRLSSILVQFSSFGDTMATMGAGWATKGAVSIATSREWRDFIMDNFPEIRKSVGDDVAFREFGEGIRAKIASATIAPLQFFDGVMRSTAASAAYQLLAAKNGIAVDLKNPDKNLIQQATKLMMQSQGSSFAKDTPLSLTTGMGALGNASLNKATLQFQSFMLNRYDNIHRQLWRLGLEKGNTGKFIMSAMWLILFGLAAEEVYRGVARKVTDTVSGRKPKKEKTLLEGTALNAIQSIPLVGQVASSITYSSNPVPIIKTAEDVSSGLGGVFLGKTKLAKKKGAVKAIGGVATLAGIGGSSQVAQIVADSMKKKVNYFRD